MTSFSRSLRKRLNFFTEQYSHISSNSEVPSFLTKNMRKSLSRAKFFTDEIFKIIRNVNPSKVHDHDKYSNVENLI